MKKLRKFLSVSVMVLSVIAMSFPFGVSVKASASAGDLIKMAGNSSVYYLGADGKRYVFPNSETYFSWYTDFSGVITIPASELQSYPLGANVTMRPGTKLVKITTDPSVYAVEPNGVLRKIQSEAQASALYGTNWSKRVVDVADAFFTNYTVGSALPVGQYPAGSLVKNASGSDIFYFDGTNYRKIANEAALSANRFNASYVLTASSTVAASGTAITDAEFVNVAQKTTSTGVVTTGSGLMVSLASDTPISANVPKAAAFVPFTTFNLTAANDGAITVSSITITRTGVGSAADLTDVYLYDGDTRLTSSRTISSSTNKATFAGLNINVSAGSTKKITVRATVANSATLGNNGFGIASASDIISSAAAVSGSFPLNGNVMSLTSGATAGTIAYSYQSVADTSVKVGQTAVELAKIKLDTSGSGEDMYVKMITLINNGSASNSDLTNLKLYRDSDLVASSATVNNDKVTFVLGTPLKIEKGNSRIFTVKGDIIGGASNTVKYEVDDATDIVAVGATYGYAASATLSASSASVVTINAGELTLELNGPASYDVTDDVDNVNLANITVTTKGNNPVEVKTLYGRIDATNNKAVDLSTAIENVQLVNTDSNQYYDVSKISSANATNYVFKVTNFTFPAGVSHWKVEFDTVKANVQDTEYFVFSMVADDTTAAGANAGIDAKNSDNKTITDINPGATITGNKVTVTTANATVAKKTLADGSAVAKTKNVKLLEFTVKAGNSSAVKVKEIDTTLNTGDKSDASNYTLWMDGSSTALKSGVNPSGDAGSAINFTSLTDGGVTIAKGETKTFYVTADMGSTVAGNLILNLTANGVKAEDPSNGNDITPTFLTFSGRTVTLADHGTVAISVDSSSLKADHIVASGSTGVEVLKMKADASDENVTMKTLSFEVTAPTAISKVALYQGSTLIQEKSTYTGTNPYYITFDNLDTLATPLVIDKDVDSVLSLKVNFANIGTGANDTAASGDQVAFTAVDATAVGYSSNKDLAAGDISFVAAGKKSYVYATKLTATKDSDQPTVLADGDKEVLKFKLTPAGNNGKTPTLKGLKVNLSMSAGIALVNAADAITLYQGSTKIGTYTPAGAGEASGTYTLTVATPDEISASGDNYVVRANLTGAGADDKVTASVKINNGAGNDDVTWDDNKDADVISISWIDLGEDSSTTRIENTINY